MPRQQQSSIADKDIITIQKNLYALKEFLDKNPHLFHSSTGDSSATRAPAMDQEAWKVCIFYESHILCSEVLSIGRAELCFRTAIFAD